MLEDSAKLPSKINPVKQKFSKSETVGPPTVYLLNFARFLDACGIMIKLFHPIDTQKLSRHSLLLFDTTSDSGKVRKTTVSELPL